MLQAKKLDNVSGRKTKGVHGAKFVITLTCVVSVE
jgi:hypothetical protein